MSIIRPDQLAQRSKKVRMLIAGHPGIGKSTLALSAPKPLHIDVDRGVDRVAARHRHPLVQPATYQELLNDLRPENIRDFDTLVIDTGGQMIKLMGLHVIATDSKNGKRDGSLSLQGYGAVGREFERFMNHCYYTLGKHVIAVFHAKEEKEGDNTRLRLLVEGQTKDNVWQPMDIGGFVEMVGNNRVLHLDNCERHFGKCCHGIESTHSLPTLNAGQPNTFLTDLFEEIQKNIAAEAVENEKLRAAYDEVMMQVHDVLLTVDDAESATRAVEMMKAINHQMTSRIESSNMLQEKARSLGLRWNKGAGCYVSADAQSA